MPVIIDKKGKFEIVQDLDINDASYERMLSSEAELIEEHDKIAHLLPAKPHKEIIIPDASLDFAEHSY